jgi:hypothetical protein
MNNQMLLKQLEQYMMNFNTQIARSQKKSERLGVNEINAFERDETVSSCLTSLSDKLTNSTYKFRHDFWNNEMNLSSSMDANGEQIGEFRGTLKEFVINNDMLFTKLTILALLDNEFSIRYMVDDTGHLRIDFNNYKVKAKELIGTGNYEDTRYLRIFNYQAPSYSLTGDNSIRRVICEIIHKKSLLQDVIAFGAPMSAMPFLHLSATGMNDKVNPDNPDSETVGAQLRAKFDAEPQMNTLVTDDGVKVEAVNRSIDYNGIALLMAGYNDLIKEVLLSQSSSTKVGAKGSYGAAESIMSNVYNIKVAALAKLKEDLVIRFAMQILLYAGEVPSEDIFGLQGKDKSLTIIPDFKIEEVISLIDLLTSNGYELSEEFFIRSLPFLENGDIKYIANIKPQ